MSCLDGGNYVMKNRFQQRWYIAPKYQLDSVGIKDIEDQADSVVDLRMK